MNPLRLMGPLHTDPLRLMNPLRARPADPREHSRANANITLRTPRVMVVNQRHAGNIGETAGAARVRRLRQRGVLDQPGEPCVLVYRMASGWHQQTGIVAEVSIGDYREGRIRRHEATEPERVSQLVARAETNGVEHVPVTLTHPVREGLRALLDEVTTHPSDVTTHRDGLAHSVWLEHDPGLVRAIQAELARVEALYIADGHHRMAAAERHARRDGQADTDHPAAFALGALFPSDEMRVLGYHRCAKRPQATTARELLAALEAQPVAAGIEECASDEPVRPGPGMVGVYLDGKWYRMGLRGSPDAVRRRDSLDVVALDEGILVPVFGRANIHPHTGVHGESDVEAVAGWCAEHGGVGFLVHPPGVADVMAVSDMGEVMPPKSTWFAPKAAPGLFVRELAGP